MHKTYETDLPQGYCAVLTIDATNTKLALFFNLAALIIMAAGIALSVIICRPSFKEIFSWKCFLVCGLFIVYIVLHELTHGAAYAVLTRRKPVFGCTHTVAFCGVPDLYVYRKTAMISLLAPFTVFDIVFLLGACLLPLPIDRFYSAALLAIHVGGCVGDLYDAWLYLTKFREPSMLMRDTGPAQTFYKKTGSTDSRCQQAE